MGRKCKDFAEHIAEAGFMPLLMEEERSAELDEHLKICQDCRDRLQGILGAVFEVLAERPDCPESDVLGRIFEQNKDDLENWIASVDRLKILQGMSCDDTGCQIAPITPEDHVRICPFCRDELHILKTLE